MTSWGLLSQCKERMRPVKKSIKALGKLPGKADAEGWDDAERAARMNEVCDGTFRYMLESPKIWVQLQ
jgi:hypothetical protein